LVFLFRGRKGEKELISGGVRIDEKCHRARVGQIGIAEQIAKMSGT
jgi:hypothetical protein